MSAFEQPGSSTAIEDVFRLEGGRILAGLIRVSGSFDRAEEALQEAFAIAIARWPRSGVPANAAAWITTAARRKLIDGVRRDRTRASGASALARELEARGETPPIVEETRDDGTLPDERLRLVFTCCHPALGQEAQVALTLRCLGGLTTAEIARAFLVPEATLAQRLVRAKNKIREAAIPYAVPSREALPERLPSVLAVVYLIFNEGYAATSGDALVRRDLAAEAIRLGRLVHELLPEEPEAAGLLALMLLHDSRRDARVSGAGELVPLEEQDRRLWDREEIARGVAVLEAALARRSPGPYQLQAAIAALHARAATAADTDWAQIAALYGELVRLTPTLVVALNHAVAVAMSEGCDVGLARIDRLPRSAGLEGYRLFHAARADLLRRLRRDEEARDAYERALALTTNPVEAAYLRRRTAALGTTTERNAASS